MRFALFPITVSLMVLSLSSLPTRPAEQLTQSLAMEPLGYTLHFPNGWFAERQDNLARIVNAPPAQATGAALDGLAKIFVTVERRANHVDAVRRLREIASEFDAPVEYMTIGGWPAMQRRVVTRKEQPGAVGVNVQEQQLLRITTAIAAGNLLIRAEARMPPNVGEQTEQQVRAIEAGISIQAAGNEADAKQDVEKLRTAPKLMPPLPPPSGLRPTNPSPMRRQGRLEMPRRVIEGALARSEEEERPGAAAPAIKGGFASEPEIAVSTDGQKIVIAQQFGYATSNDGGLTFPTTGSFLANSTGGDSSLAYGKSGNFYEGTIFNSSSALNSR